MIPVKKIELLHQIPIDKFGGSHGIRDGLENVVYSIYTITPTIIINQ